MSVQGRGAAGDAPVLRTSPTRQACCSRSRAITFALLAAVQLLLLFAASLSDTSATPSMGVPVILSSDEQHGESRIVFAASEEEQSESRAIRRA
eukprot:6985555-Prymnesium_polylepis.1